MSGKVRLPHITYISELKGYSDNQLSFKDESGGSLSKEQFLELTKADRSFSIFESKNDKTLVFKLSKKLTAEEKAQAKAEAKAGGNKKALALKVGDALPEFTATKLDGKSVGRAELLGKPTLFSFFFSQCLPCVKEVPELNALKTQHGAAMNFLGMTFDDKVETQRFQAKYGLTLDVVVDAKKILNTQFGVNAYPTLMLVGADGKVLATRIGGHFDDKQDTIARWLETGLAAKKS